MDDEDTTEEITEEMTAIVVGLLATYGHAMWHPNAWTVAPINDPAHPHRQAAEVIVRQVTYAAIADVCTSVAGCTARDYLEAYLPKTPWSLRPGDTYKIIREVTAGER